MELGAQLARGAFFERTAVAVALDNARGLGIESSKRTGYRAKPFQLVATAPRPNTASLTTLEDETAWAPAEGLLLAFLRSHVDCVPVDPLAHPRHPAERGDAPVLIGVRRSDSGSAATYELCE